MPLRTSREEEDGVAEGAAGEAQAKRQRTDLAREPDDRPAAGGPLNEGACAAPPASEAHAVPLQAAAVAHPPAQDHAAALPQGDIVTPEQAMAFANAMGPLGTWGEPGAAGNPTLHILQHLQQLQQQAAGHVLPQQAAQLPGGGLPHADAPGSFLDQLHANALYAVGSEGLATPGGAAERGHQHSGVMRVQSRPPPMGAKFDTPRRTVKPFSEVEVETLVEGVVKYGTGRWREILTAADAEGRFDPVRTGVDLKDKWRSLKSAVMGNKDTRRVALKEEWKEKIRRIAEAEPPRRSLGGPPGRGAQADAHAAMGGPASDQGFGLPSGEVMMQDHMMLTPEHLAAIHEQAMNMATNMHATMHEHDQETRMQGQAPGQLPA
ncbi:hypothetical protein WJX81_002525 [Elliptochloris bilobata]|uniref:Myb-like domain-containing protein n=1 Tax=Elliptochloris bilobata TaxID=381761 RepID=A0AAW1QPL2_9CHLO